jgi:hypothetical protein
MPNNQEWAILIWIGVGLAFLMVHPTFRPGALRILSAMTRRKVLLAFIVMLAWIALEVWLAQTSDLWNLSLASETVIWVFSSGFVLFLAYDSAQKRRFFRDGARGTVRTSAVLTCWISLFPLSFVAELFVEPIVLFLILLGMIATLRDEWKDAKKFVDRVLGVILAGLLVWSATETARHWRSVANAQTLRQLLLPTWLVLGVLPLVFGVALYAEYETLFLNLRLRAQESEALSRARRSLLLGLNVRTRLVHHFSSEWQGRLLESTTDQAARAVIAQYRGDLFSVSTAQADE